MFAFVFTQEGAPPSEPSGGVGAGSPGESEEISPAWVPLFFGMFFLIFAGFGGFLVGRILLFVAQWHIWSALQDLLAARGVAPRASPIVLLLVEIFGPQAMQFVVSIIMMVVMFGSIGLSATTGVPPVWLIVMVPVLLLLIAAPVLWVIYETQRRVLAAPTAPG